jgi:hypothetical protein
MPRSPDSGQLDLQDVFARLQHRLLADLSIARLFEHASTNGAATELQWINLFHAFLPSRYRAASAFIINSRGRRSRQIDIAIYDQHSALPLFPHETAVHVPIESVYAVFEVKPTFSKQWFRDAAEKIESVRALSRARTPHLAGILAASSVWTPKAFRTNLPEALAEIPRAQRLTIGCALDQGAFDHTARKLTISKREQALANFLLRLVHHLNRCRTREPNLLTYLKHM